MPSRKFGIIRGIALPFLFVAIPMGLIIEQPDLGNGVIILILFTAVLYLTGVRLKYIFIFILLMILSLPLFWHFLLLLNYFYALMKIFSYSRQ